MEEKEYLKILTDVVFKRVFSETKNQAVLEGFLRAVIDIPDEDFEKLTVVDPNFRIGYENEKTSILDIKIETKTGKILNVELQVLPYPRMDSRLLYYSSKLVSDQLMKGEAYENIKKVINITILDYNMIKTDEEYMHRFKLYDKKTMALLTDEFEIVTLELKKVPPEDDETEVYEWMRFFKAQGKEEIDMIAKETGNTAIKEAVMVIKELSQDEELRLLAEAREKNLKDEVSRLSAAKREGIEEGKREGLEEGKREGLQEGKREGLQESAKALILAGSDINFVKEVLKLSDEDMKKINEEMSKGK